MRSPIITRRTPKHMIESQRVLQNSVAATKSRRFKYAKGYTRRLFAGDSLDSEKIQLRGDPSPAGSIYHSRPESGQPNQLSAKSIGYRLININKGDVYINKFMNEPRSVFYSAMAKGTIDLSKAFPEKLVIKECHGRKEEVNRDDLLNVDDKNWNTIVCRRCDSVIFPEDKVMYVEDYTADLPEMVVGGKGSTASEKISWWWHTKNDKDFDTIGFAWVVVDGKKTLLCGDCEFGPIGLRTPDDKEFWVAVERVRYVDKQPRHPKAPPKKAKKAKQ